MALRYVAGMAIGMGLVGSAMATDFAIGGNRQAGMAGAGLALRGSLAGSRPNNPAMLAYQQRFRIADSNLSFRLNGAGLSDWREFFDRADQAVFDSDNLVDIARRFGDGQVDGGLELALGFTASGWFFGGFGQGAVTTRPNAQLQQWVNAGSNLAAPVAGMQLDGYGYGQTEFRLGYGRVVSADGGDLSVGVMGRFVRGYYTHHRIDANGIVSGNAGATLAPEMGGQDVLEDDGFGLDFGLAWFGGKEQGFSAAFVVKNLVTPNVRFGGTLPNSVPGLTTVDPNQRSVSLGFAYQTKENFAFAADMVGLGTNNQEGRIGADWMLSRSLGVRTGYSSRDGFVAGANFGSLFLTYGGANSLRLGTFFRF